MTFGNEFYEGESRTPESWALKISELVEREYSLREQLHAATEETNQAIWDACRGDTNPPELHRRGVPLTENAIRSRKNNWDIKLEERGN